MVMKKIMSSEDGIAIIANSETKDSFPVGFKYMLGSTIYTVDKIVNKDPNSDMRRVVSSEGDVEILPIESIIKDMKEFDCKVLDDGVKKEEKNKSTTKKNEI